MEDGQSLQVLMDSGTHVIGDLVWSVVSSYNSLLLEMGYKCEDLNAAAKAFEQEFNTGKIAIRKKSNRAATRGKGVEKKDKYDGKDGKKKKYEDIVERARTITSKKPDLKWSKLSDEIGEDKIPAQLMGADYCDNKELGLGKNESLVASKKMGKYAAQCIINSNSEYRYLTTEEADRFQNLGLIIDKGAIDGDDDEEFCNLDNVS